MKRIIKVRSGEVVPDNAKYLHSSEELDRSKSYTYESINSNDPWNYTPLGFLFGTIRIRTVTPRVTIHHYEIEEQNESKS